MKTKYKTATVNLVIALIPITVVVIATITVNTANAADVTRVALDDADMHEVVDSMMALIWNMFGIIILLFVAIDGLKFVMRKKEKEKESDNELDTETDNNHLFLLDLPEIKSQYETTLALSERIKKSAMTTIQKTRAAKTMLLVESVIDTARSAHGLGVMSLLDRERVLKKLVELHSGLAVLVRGQMDTLFSEFDNIKIPDTYSKQDELETLKLKGQELLDKVKKYSVVDTNESEFVLDKIVNNRLDEVWQDYVSAKKSEGNATSNSLNDSNADVIISDIFTEIRRVYKDIDISLDSGRQSETISSLLDELPTTLEVGVSWVIPILICDVLQ